MYVEIVFFSPFYGGERKKRKKNIIVQKVYLLSIAADLKKKEIKQTFFFTIKINGVFFYFA